MAKRRSKKLRCPADSLTEDLVLEILSRLPVKSLIRFKCVSKTWLILISDNNNRSKLCQTLAGFLYNSINPERSPLFALHFTNVSGVGFPLILPTFNFLPKYETVSLLDCCNGLLLCRCHGASAEHGFHYVVLNPATKKWCALPDSSQAGQMCTARLGFDAAVSSPHFHVFEFSLDDDRDSDSFVEVYSSKTGRWVRNEDGWDDDISFICDESATVFLNGCLHFLTIDNDIAVVDTEGKAMRNIPLPDGMDCAFIQKSQGCLHFACFEICVDQLSIYVLEDYDSQVWILKHRVQTSDIFPSRYMELRAIFQWVAIHPDSNLFFFTVGRETTLMSYDMNRQYAKIIRPLGLGSGYGQRFQPQYLPYVPLYSELQALHI